MGRHVSGELVKLMIRGGITMRGAKVLVPGLAFKENCADIRNSRIIDIIEELQSHRIDVDIHDPWISGDAAESKLGIETIDQPARADYDGVIVTVAHDHFRGQGIEAICAYTCNDGVIYDVKGAFPRDTVDARL